MCNRARLDGDPETLRERFGAKWLAAPPNRWPVELAPVANGIVIREEDGERVIDAMSWDVLGGQAKWPMTNVRNLALPQWKRLAERPERRCLVPLTEFCEWTPTKHDLGDGKPPLKGEMWFAVENQPMFAVAGFWQPTAQGNGFTMVTCDPNEVVAPVHPKAMIIVLAPDDHERWLHGAYDDIVALQRPYPADRMRMRGPVFPTRAVG